MKQYDIYGIGAALLDTEIEVEESDLEKFKIEKGVMTLVDEQRQTELMASLENHLVHSKKTSGGSAANSIIAANYFGAKNFYSCKVSNDANGALYLDDLRNAGVAYHNHNGNHEGITGKCLVMITPDAERTMNTFLGVSETLSASDIDEDALAQSTFAYIEGYLVTSATGKPAAIKVRELAKASGVKTALSLSDPAMAEFFREGLLEMVGDGVDLLFCNKDEAISFTQAENLTEACEKLKDFASSFAVTLGAEGALVFDGTSTFTIEGCPAQAVDTNGAGDMFAGAFLYGITHGLNYAEAARLANRAAAQVVSQYGPRLRPEQHRTILEGS